MKYSTECDFSMGRNIYCTYVREDALYVLSLSKSYVHIGHWVKSEE